MVYQDEYMASRGTRVVQVIEGQAGLKHVSAGDFVISLRSFQGGIEWSAAPGKISPAYTVLTPRRRVVERYFVYLLKSDGFIQELRSTSNQLRDGQSLGVEHFAQVPVPLPPPTEQEEISRFLDRETAKIDALIAKQAQLIATVREDRTATITRAVTTGLDSRVLMKASELEWIGEIPAHWTATRLGRLCRSISDGPHFSPSYVDDGVMFLSARNVKVDGWFLEDAKYISEDDYKEFSRRVVPEVGDVLYTKGGTTGVARAVDLTQRFQVWVHVAVLKLRQGLVTPDYLAYALNSSACYEQSQLYTRGATNQDLGLTRMVRIVLALPPLDEQSEIVKFLDERCGNIDALIAKATEVIETLREYRSALITDAVTGKIDVRAAA
ncbi:restriction endonuclease subunit S [Aldersonia sp. NBC_00410]|nr:restriction endonuclease subunit S [Aldersonia sp. NBC_00410]